MNQKKIGYLLFGLISSFYRLFPINRRKNVFYMIHNDHKCGNLKFMLEALKKERQENVFIFVSKRDLFGKQKIFGIFYFYFILNFHLMTASEVYLNDNFLPLAYMPFRKKTKVIQLWHGIGAFKRFGLSTETDPVTRKAVITGNKKLTHLFISGSSVLPFYEEAFQVSRDKIYPVGLPVLDFYFDEDLRKKARENFYGQFPFLKHKKLLLFTPTFRKTMRENQELMEAVSIHKLKKLLGEEWAILLRLHPTISESGIIGNLPPFVYDVSTYPDVKELYEVSTCLVNDYSSTVVEYALLRKPILFFAPDLEKYDRGFYRDYLSHAPGEILTEVEDLAKAVLREKADLKKIEDFLSLHYDYFDSNNCKRILEVLNGERRKERKAYDSSCNNG